MRVLVGLCGGRAAIWRLPAIVGVVEVSIFHENLTSGEAAGDAIGGGGRASASRESIISGMYMPRCDLHFVIM